MPLSSLGASAIPRLAAKLMLVVPPCGAIAQLGERLVRNEEVSGSIPLSSTKHQVLAHVSVQVKSKTSTATKLPNPHL
jgi:hypothetical protein